MNSHALLFSLLVVDLTFYMGYLKFLTNLTVRPILPALGTIIYKVSFFIHILKKILDETIDIMNSFLMMLIKCLDLIRCISGNFWTQPLKTFLGGLKEVAMESLSGPTLANIFISRNVFGFEIALRNLYLFIIIFMSTILYLNLKSKSSCNMSITSILTSTSHLKLNIMAIFLFQISIFQGIKILLFPYIIENRLTLVLPQN